MTTATATKTPTKELVAFIETLLIAEYERLEQSLLPVLKARKAMLDYYRITIPADLAALKRVNDKRTIATEKGDSLLQLDEELKEVRKRISGTAVEGWIKGGHENTKVELTKQYKKAKERFAGSY